LLTDNFEQSTVEVVSAFECFAVEMAADRNPIACDARRDTLPNIWTAILALRNYL
jgi:hypothetical protein